MSETTQPALGSTEPNPAEQKQPERYQLAAASRRAIAAFLDLVLMTMVAVGIGTLFVYQDLYINQQQSFYEVVRSLFVRDEQSAGILDTISVEYWRMVGFAICTLLAYFCYFTVIPMFTRGRTLFCWLFFIRKVELHSASQFFWHLLLRDLFVWIVPILLGVALVLSNPSGSLGRLFSYFSFSEVYVSDPGPVIVKTLYAVSLVLSMVQIVYMFVKNKRLALHDQFSNTAVIYEREAAPVRKKPLVKRELDAFPGMGVPVADPTAPTTEQDKAPPTAATNL